MARLFGPTGAPGAPGSVPLNTTGAPSAGNAPLPALQTILNTTETVILNPGLSSPTAALILNIEPMTKLEQLEFYICASGYLNNGTSSTVTLKLYSGTSTAVASNTLLSSSGAITAFAGKTPWRMRATCVFDSVSGKLTGSANWLVNNTVVAETAFSSVVTGVSNANNPVLSFVLSETLGTAGTQQINVKEFGCYDL